MADFISFTATVRTAAGAEHTLRTNTYDLYRAEKALGRPLKLIYGVILLEEAFSVIHSAARRAGIAGDDLEAWLAEVDLAVDPDGGEGDDTSPLSPSGSELSSSEPE